MTEQHREFSRHGAQVIAIVHDSMENALLYVESHPIPFPLLLDPSHEAYNRYQVESKTVSLGQRPGLFIVDREGMVQFAYIGWQQWQIPKNAEVLEICRLIPCQTAG